MTRLGSRLRRAALLFGAIAQVAARGDTNFVSPTGAHIAPFLSWADAATNIQAAVDAATNGNTVLVTNGIFEPFQVPAYSKTITIRSVNGWSATIIDGGGTTRCVGMFTPFDILDGFTLRHGFDGGTVGGGGLFANVDNLVVNCLVVSNAATYGGGIECVSCTVSNSRILNNTASAEGGGIDYLPGQDSYTSCISRCVISGNVAVAGAGIWAEQTLQLEHCTIAGNTASNEGGGLYKNACVGCFETGVAAIRNCLIIGNTAASNGAGVFANSTTALVNNCILFTNDAAAGVNYAAASDTITFAYSCAEPLASGPGNIASDPQFAAAPEGDTHLRAASPCVDAGTSLVWIATATDIDGQPRLAGPYPDMGADEAQFVVRAIARNSTSTLLAVDAVIDGAFLIDASPSLTSVAWTSVSQVVTADLAIATISDTNVPSSARLYRAVWLH